MGKALHVEGNSCMKVCCEIWRQLANINGKKIGKSKSNDIYLTFLNGKRREQEQKSLLWLSWKSRMVKQLYILSSCFNGCTFCLLMFQFFWETLYPTKVLLSVLYNGHCLYTFLIVFFFFFLRLSIIGVKFKLLARNWVMCLRKDMNKLVCLYENYLVEEKNRQNKMKMNKTIWK